MVSIMTRMTQTAEKVREHIVRIEECTVLEYDSDGKIGIQCHSPPEEEQKYRTTCPIKPRSKKQEGEWHLDQHKNVTVLNYGLLGHRFGHPWTPRAGDLVLVLFVMHYKPIILGPVNTNSQKPLMRAPTCLDAMYDWVWKWCQWRRPLIFDKNGDCSKHLPGINGICAKIFHGPVTGEPGKGRDLQMIFDCQKGNEGADEIEGNQVCAKCMNIDSVPRKDESWFKIYSKQTESCEAPNSRIEMHGRCGSYIRMENECSTCISSSSCGKSKEYTEGRGHIRIGNAVEECEKRGHINFMPSGTIDVHSNHEETCISNEAHGARLTVVHEETNDLEDGHGPISCDLTDLPTWATVRIYKDGCVKIRSNDAQKNPKSEMFLTNTGHCYLWNIVTDAYIEMTDDEKVTVHSDKEIVLDAPLVTITGDCVINGSITHGVDNSCTPPPK